MINKLNTKFANYNEAQIIIGNNDGNLKLLEYLFDVELSTRGEEILVKTEDKQVVAKIEELFKVLKSLVRQGVKITDRDIIYLSNMSKENQLEKAVDLYTKRRKIVTTNKGETIYSKSIKQTEYLNAINKNDLVFGVGPAGTGKTFITVIDAIAKLKSGDIKKIILTRPAVEAGESLGFLPGDLKEKIDPYLQPLYDALNICLSVKGVEESIEKGIIEIAPLAYMRGRTLDNAYIILDEAQNTTEKQMKMFLTRLGTNSKMVVTGDVSQIDLPKKERSGLKLAINLLHDVRGIKVVEFSRVDVVRHPLVQEILRKYEKYENVRN